MPHSKNPPTAYLDVGQYPHASAHGVPERPAHPSRLVRHVPRPCLFDPLLFHPDRIFELSVTTNNVVQVVLRLGSSSRSPFLSCPPRLLDPLPFHLFSVRCQSGLSDLITLRLLFFSAYLSSLLLGPGSVPPHPPPVSLIAPAAQVYLFP